jgi:hypothetical protein
LDKRFKNRKYSTKGVLKMSAVLEKEQKPQKLNCLSNARNIVQKTMKEHGFSREQVIKSFMEIRYGKSKS